MNVVVRPAEASEAYRLTGIAHAAKSHWGYPEEHMRLWRGELTISPQFIRDHVVFCADRGGVVLGFGALTHADHWELDHLWVRPDYHGIGVGTLLFRHAMDRARTEGAAEVRIVSDPNAVEFYEKRGARLVGSVASRVAGRELPVLEIGL